METGWLLGLYFGRNRRQAVRVGSRINQGRPPADPPRLAPVAKRFRLQAADHPQRQARTGILDVVTLAVAACVIPDRRDVGAEPASLEGRNRPCPRPCRRAWVSQAGPTAANQFHSSRVCSGLALAEALSGPSVDSVDAQVSVAFGLLARFGIVSGDLDELVGEWKRKPQWLTVPHHPRWPALLGEEFRAGR